MKHSADKAAAGQRARQSVAGRREAGSSDFHRASARLEALAERVRNKGGDVSVGEIFDELGEAGLGLTILLLALPVFLPTPGLPVGLVFGLAMMAVAAQAACGSDRLILPERLRRRQIGSSHVVSLVSWAAPWLRRAEAWLRPRLTGLADSRARAFLAWPVLLLGLLLTLPIPFGNQPGALAVVALALGMLERDGLAILVGLLLTAAAFVWTAFVVFASVEVIDRVWHGLTTAALPVRDLLIVAA